MEGPEGIKLAGAYGEDFVSKPVPGKSDVTRVLEKSEIGSKKASVYAGDNPVNRVRLPQPRPIYISIHDRERPPFKMIVTHRSKLISRRKPLGVDAVIDYEKDSDEEYEEEKEGEDLNSNADNEEENNELEEGAESEADSFLFLTVISRKMRICLMTKRWLLGDEDMK